MQPGLVSPVFVGRGPELTALVAALDSAVAGEPAVVLVGGEAGVGKTRLVEEAAEGARERAARVLTGSCIELGGEGMPLSPMVDALRTLTRVMDPDELDGFLGPARPDLARLLPELDPEAAGRPTPSGESGGARLLELVFGVIQRLSAARPLMLVIEDLQWADRSTLDLVSLLVRGMRAMHVLLVLTFRSDEIHRSHPLRPLIAAWERVRSVRRLELPRFTREEATLQLEAILGSSPPRSMVEPLYERSEGNAFLIEEILAAMQAGAGPDELPVTLRDVLLARAERLSEPALRLLRVAAAAGASVSDRLLAAVARFDEASLDAALAETIEHQLLAADDTDHGYRFRHALTRDAIYADTMPRERVRTHVAYAEALSSDPSLGGSAASAAAALAIHWYAAHNAQQALVASIDAARLATAYAPAEAMRHLERRVRRPHRAARAGRPAPGARHRGVRLPPGRRGRGRSARHRPGPPRGRLTPRSAHVGRLPAGRWCPPSDAGAVRFHSGGRRARRDGRCRIGDRRGGRRYRLAALARPRGVRPRLRLVHPGLRGGDRHRRALLAPLSVSILGLNGTLAAIGGAVLAYAGLLLVPDPIRGAATATTN